MNSNDILRQAILRSRATPKPYLRSQGIPLPLINSRLPTPSGVKLRIAPASVPKPISLNSLFKAKDEPDLRRRISTQLTKILQTKLQVVDARKIPYTEDIAHVGEAKNVESSVLHIDIRNSSSIVEELSPEVALKVYQIFHNCVAETARYKDGNIRTFAGDRVVILFNPGKENLPRTRAVETAILIDKMLTDIINPALEQNRLYALSYGIGIDFGSMLTGRVGKYGKQNNDLVWAGKAMNYASKLADYGNGIFLSKSVYDGIINTSRKNNDNNFFQKRDRNLGEFYQLIHLPLI